MIACPYFLKTGHPIKEVNVLELSVWQHGLPNLPLFPTLSGELKCEAAIVGAGMTGLLTAFALRELGIHAVVLEAGLPGSGITADSPAQITLQNGLLFRHLLGTLGLDLAHRYLRQQQNAIEQYEALVHRLSIPCEFHRTDAYLFDSRSSQALHREWEAIQLTGIPARLVTETELPFPISRAICLPDQAYFHPLKFLYGLIPHLQIFAHTPVLRIQDGVLTTSHGRVLAKHVVVTAHHASFELPDRHVRRLRQERTCVLSCEGTPPLSGMYHDLSPDGLSFRPYSSGILLSGGRQRAPLPVTCNRLQHLYQQAKQFWPNCRVTAAWRCLNYFSRDGLPYVGAYSGRRADLYVASGFSGWGMTSAMVASQFISHRIAANR